MRHRLFSLYEALILKHPLAVLLVTLITIGGLAGYIPGFKLDASSDSLVLEGDKALQYYREVSKRYQSESFLLVAYQPHQPLMADTTLDTISQMRDELAAITGVSSVLSILDVPLLQSPPVSLNEIASGKPLNTLRTPGIDKAMALKEFSSSPIYRDLLTSAEADTTAIIVNIQRDQHYIDLLEERERLRERQRSAGLSEDEKVKLDLAELAFRNYATLVRERESKLVKDVRGVIDNYRDRATIYLGGVPMIAADMISYIQSDLVMFGSGICIFIVLMLIVIFRSVLWVVLPLITCVLSTLFMLGLITALDWRMTVISSNFVAILLIITLSITIHLVVRYRELLAADPEIKQYDAVRETMLLMAKPCIYTALTTIVAFASLVISGIRPVIDFGWMMTLGVTAALVIVFLIFPSTLMLLPRPTVKSIPGSPSGLTIKFAAFTARHGRGILVAGALLTVMSAVGISMLKVENRFIDYFDESTAIYQGMEIIDAELGGTIPLEIIIDAKAESLDFTPSDSAAAEGGAGEEFDEAFADGGDTFDDFAAVDSFSERDDFDADITSSAGGRGQISGWFNRAGLERIEAVHDYLDAQPEVGKVMSLATIYKTLRQLTSGLDDIQLALIYNKIPDSVGNILIAPFTDEEHAETRITVRVMETSRSLHRNELLHKIQHDLINKFGFSEDQIHLTGMLVLYNNMLQSLYKSQVLTLGAVFLAITLMFWILFRSLSLAIIAIAPNILAACIVLGGMGLLGIPLDIMTVTIAAIVVGIGVDDTIHYVHRFVQEFPHDRKYTATMYRCHGSIGKAMYYTSVTIIFGFSVLTLSNFTPSIYFGLLTGTAMFAALLGALLLLPQLLITFKPLGPESAEDQQ